MAMPYKINIDVKDMHHMIAFASLFIADSQSMIVEACMLGVPSIRYNSFVGKISVLEELEKKYSLTSGILNNNPVQLYRTVKNMLENVNLSKEFTERKNIMLRDKINVSEFFTWFIENYPQSKQEMSVNQDYQEQFR
jgi:hypothetical protein